MSVQDLKRKFIDTIQAYQALDPYEVRRMFAEAIRECEIQQGWDESSKLKPWYDDELRTILSDAPTKENFLKYARAFNRGYGAIEQIYRWAATSTILK